MGEKQSGSLANSMASDIRMDSNPGSTTCCVTLNKSLNTILSFFIFGIQAILVNHMFVLRIK